MENPEGYEKSKKSVIYQGTDRSCPVLPHQEREVQHRKITLTKVLSISIEQHGKPHQNTMMIEWWHIFLSRTTAKWLCQVHNDNASK